MFLKIYQNKKLQIRYFIYKIDILYLVPKSQINKIRKFREGNDNPIILVLNGGSPIEITEVVERIEATLHEPNSVGLWIRGPGAAENYDLGFVHVVACIVIGQEP